MHISHSFENICSYVYICVCVEHIYIHMCVYFIYTHIMNLFLDLFSILLQIDLCKATTSSVVQPELPAPSVSGPSGYPKQPHRCSRSPSLKVIAPKKCANYVSCCLRCGKLMLASYMPVIYIYIQYICIYYLILLNYLQEISPPDQLEERAEP